MSYFELLVTIAVYLLIFLVLGSIVTGLIAWRRLSRRNAPASNTQPHARDAANMTILFQTMRDMLEEQKALARQLNESFDNKIAQIDKMVDQARNDVDRLRQTAAQLSQAVEQTKEDLASVQRQVSYLKNDAAPAQASAEPLASDKARHENAPEPAAAGRHGHDETPPEPELKAEPEPSDKEIAAGSAESFAETGTPSSEGATRDGGKDRPALQILAMPDEANEEDLEEQQPTDFWLGARHTVDPADEGAISAGDAAPEEPGDPEAAREAFRALLNLDDNGGESAFDADAVWPPNGMNSQHAPVKARVYEYSDAGMTVGQIASELGIGKGEVRLILSLRDEQGAT